jgi:NAD(P)-dependent dehydrogenase (short-subunit alcohol dehydrogenase family)
VPEATFIDKIVVVTGAGHRLGQGIARRFGQAGAHVVVTDGDVEAGSSAANALSTDGLSSSFETLDARHPAHSLAVVDRLVRERGRIDVWVNATGAARMGPAETLPREAWQAAIDLTLSGAFYCCQAAGRQMLDQGQGVIVNLSSINGYKAIEGGVARSVADAGLIMLTQALGIEWASRGVRVVGVSAGATPELVAESASGTDGAAAHEHRAPMRRLGTVDDVAEAVLYVASDQASYLVAETLRVDGGWVAYQLF